MKSPLSRSGMKGDLISTSGGYEKRTANSEQDKPSCFRMVQPIFRLVTVPGSFSALFRVLLRLRDLKSQYSIVLPVGHNMQIRKHKPGGRLINDNNRMPTLSLAHLMVNLLSQPIIEQIFELSIENRAYFRNYKKTNLKTCCNCNFPNPAFPGRLLCSVFDHVFQPTVSARLASAWVLAESNRRIPPGR